MEKVNSKQIIGAVYSKRYEEKSTRVRAPDLWAGRGGGMIPNFGLLASFVSFHVFYVPE